MARIHVKNADLTVRVALGFDKALLLNLPAAARAGLRAFPLIGKQTIKNRLMPGGEALVRGNFYDVAVAGLSATTVPTLWFDRALADDSDGVISALAVPGDHVVVEQASVRPGGVVYAITRTGAGAAAMRADVGGTKVNVILDLKSPETILNGRAAQLFEAAGLVRRGSTVGLWRPFPGVALPFERLIPTPGAKLLGLPLVAPAARVTEARAREIDARARAGTSSPDQDDDAITVTATKHRSGPPWVLIGRDVLGHCSRIELDRPGARWVLTCNFAG
ncbi:MAG: hypothetical protein ACRYG4_18125 [Janthinobacterium lividum]